MVKLVWPWLGAALVGSFLLGLLATFLWSRWGRRGPVVAHTDWVRELPAIRAAIRRDRVGAVVAAVGVALALVGASVVAARPVEEHPTTQEMGRRDIVLCLDVSGSMIPYDAAILRRFQELTKSFDGERIALSVFNATSRTVFPLTDDYDMVLEQLAEVEHGLDVDLSGAKTIDDLDTILTPEQVDALLAVWAGTLSVDASSLIGDGLANCSLLFDDGDTDRTRSIILATDNDEQGTSVYNLRDGAALASSRDASLYGLFPEDMRDTYQDLGFSTALEEAGGTVWYAEDPQAIEAVIAEVVADQVETIAADAPPTLTDRQGAWTLLAGLGLVLLLVGRVWGRR